MYNKIVNDKLGLLFALPTMTEGQKIMMIEKMATVVNQRLLLRLLDFLSADLKKEFEKMLDKDGEDSALESFLIKNVPDFMDWVEEEIIKLNKEMKEVLK
jgi:hypothetical protein